MFSFLVLQEMKRNLSLFLARLWNRCRSHVMPKKLYFNLNSVCSLTKPPWNSQSLGPRDWSVVWQRKQSVQTGLMWSNTWEKLRQLGQLVSLHNIHYMLYLLWIINFYSLSACYTNHTSFFCPSLTRPFFLQVLYCLSTLIFGTSLSARWEILQLTWAVSVVHSVGTVKSFL